MGPFAFLMYYGNGVVTLLTAIAFSFEGNDGLASLSTHEFFVYVIVFAGLAFAMLAIWFFSIGAIITMVQLFYGLVRYFLGKPDIAYLHHCAGAAVAVFGYVIIMLPAAG